MKTRFQESKIIPNRNSVVIDVYVAYRAGKQIHKRHMFTRTLENYTYKYTDIRFRETYNQEILKEAIKLFKKESPDKKVVKERSTIWGHVYVDEYNADRDEQYIHPAYITLAGII